MRDMLQFFAYEHLPAHLQAVSKPFGDLVRELAASLPANAESTTALRKLLEAKDCAVRAVLFNAAEGEVVVQGSVDASQVQAIRAELYAHQVALQTGVARAAK